MKILNVREARFGARGDGTGDDTAAIQRAVDRAAVTGATVRIPKGIYLVDAVRSVRLRSRMALALDSGAVLKAMPNAAAHSAILLASDVEDLRVSGGVLEGERAGHRGQGGQGGEWGHGLSLLHAKRVTVESVTARDCWGDGFYVASSAQLVFSRVIADHNRRQGLSITSGRGVTVRDSAFRNTGGTLPEDGIDIEPNPGETAEDIRIQRCRFEDNAGFGIEIGVPLSYAGRAWIHQVVVEENRITGSGKGTLSASPRAGIEASNTGGHRIADNTVCGNGAGILLRNQADRFLVTGNTVDGNAGDGIVQYLCTGNTITGNRIRRNGGRALYSPESKGGEVGPNEIEEKGRMP